MQRLQQPIYWTGDKNGTPHPLNASGKTHGCIARRLGGKTLLANESKSKVKQFRTYKNNIFIMLLSNRQIFDMATIIGQLGNACLDEKATFAIFKNLDKLNSVYSSLEKTRQSLVKNLIPKDSNEISEGSEEMKTFLEKWNALLDSEEKTEIEIHQFDHKGLKLDVNNIPIGIVRVLMPLFYEEDEQP